MADRPKGYGFTAETSQKTVAKFDPQFAREAMDWIASVLGGSSNCGGKSDHDQVHEALKDGIVLCNLANRTGGKIKVHESKMAFKQMENIGHFLSYCETIGMNKVDLFQTVDLYEKQNMAAVILNIHAFGRKIQTHPGCAGLPKFGVKEATANRREFDAEEQLRKGSLYY